MGEGGWEREGGRGRVGEGGWEREGGREGGRGREGERDTHYVYIIQYRVLKHLEDATTLIESKTHKYQNNAQ